MMSSNRIRHAALNLAAVAIGFVIALILLEVALRFYNPFESRLKGDKIVLPTNRKYVYEAGDLRGTDRTIIHTKNAIGFRGPDVPADSLQNHLSIIVVGGSTTECAYLSDGKDWPEVLGVEVAEDFRSVWLDNAGLDGHSTFGHTILMRDIIIDLHPKLAIFLVGANDEARKAIDQQTAAQLKGPLLFTSLEGFVKSAAAYSEVASLALNVYRYSRAKLQGLPHHNVDLAALPQAETADADLEQKLEPHEEKYVPAYRERLLALVRMTEAAGIDPVLVTQPTLWGEGVDPVTGVDLANVVIGPDKTGRTYWTILQLYNQATREVGAEEDALTIDLANSLEKNSEYFYDGIHFTNAGAAEVAKVIYRDLRPYLEEHYGSFARTTAMEESPQANSMLK
jgi:lysophospholipase L1-like esterase